jgi:PIN domain nuclease of toxin-antitoxin system
MQVILLDTHAWIWWVTKSKKLSSKALAAIQKSLEIGISVISCWEVAMLVAKGRIGFSMNVSDWIHKSLTLDKVRLVGLSPEIAIRSTCLPGVFHGDPADRFLIASALDQAAPLVTKDAAIRNYQHCRTVW